MNFLAINTSGDKIEIVLNVEKKVLFKNGGGNKQACAVLMPLIDSLLEEAKVTLNNLDFFGCCIGAGSFTGIRIGVATIRAFAHALNKKIAVVTAAECLSYNELDCKGENIITASDAGNGFIYVAEFTSPAEYVRKTECIKSSEVAAYLDKVKKPYRVVCEQSVSAHFIAPYIVDDGCAALNKAVENAAKNSGNFVSINQVEPLYIRIPQAERDLAKRLGN